MDTFMIAFGLKGMVIAGMIWVGFYLTKSEQMDTNTTVQEAVTINANNLAGHLWWVGACICLVV